MQARQPVGSFLSLTLNTLSFQGLKSENIRLLVDKSNMSKRVQELSRTRDTEVVRLQAELAKLKKVCVFFCSSAESLNSLLAPMTVQDSV